MEEEKAIENEHKRELPPPAEDTETTPGWIRDYANSLFPIDFDPLEFAYSNDEFEPFIHDWKGFSFVHPPHADAQLWVEKAAIEANKGNFSVMFLPAVFNAVYWREVIYRHATEIRVFVCPVKLPGKKKQIVSQMCLVVFAGAIEGAEYPPVFPVEPTGWENHYYKRPRNRARFSVNR
jgi:hypothetical protein